MSVDDDWYKILGVTDTATAEEIKVAFKKKVLELHPDRNSSGTELFKKVVEAHKILSNSESRSNYDRRKSTYSIFSNSKLNIASPSEVVSQITSNLGNILEEDLFDTLNKFLGKGPERQNIEIEIPISLEDLYHGSDKEITYHRLEVCEECRGRGAIKREDFKICHICFGSGVSPSLAALFRKQECKVCKGIGKIIINKCSICQGKGVCKKEVNLIIPIPNDLSPTDRLIVPKEGQADGDLIIQLNPEPHPFFEIINDIDLLIELPVTFYQLILGDYLEIETLKGPAHFKLEESAQLEDSTVLKGYGLRRGDKIGDLIIKYVLQIPKKITKPQKELLEKYRDLDCKKRDKI